MVCATFTQHRSPIHALDVRVRLVAAVALSVPAALADRPEALAAALAGGAALAVLARLPVAPALGRLASVNAFMVLLALLLPLTVPGEAAFALGPLAWSGEGLIRAAAIAAKGNAIVLVLTALLSTVEPMELGRALASLRVPNRLIHLYVFTVRYLDILHHEYDRLRRAMRVRAFRPGMSVHTYRSVGYLVGMLLVNSFDRSHRVLAAMKCRGFTGRFPLAAAPRPGAADTAFALAAFALAAMIGGLQWA